MSELASIVSPVDGSVYAQRPLIGGGEALRGVDEAAAAQRAWRRFPLERRIRILSEAVDRLVSRTDAIVEELAWQMGRPVSQGAGEVRGFQERARYMLEIAPNALADLDAGEKTGFKRYIRHEPLGVVLTVAPWNFPYMTAVNSVWPALAAGNAVILKHARHTLICAERMAEALRDAGLPEHVFTVLHMGHDTTAQIMQVEAVRMVCFTGSVRGGRAVQRAISDGGGFAGTGLELGGKDPAYVRADAHLDSAVAAIADGAFFNSGQSCCSVERAYVHQSVYDEFLDRMIAESRKLKLGNPLDPSTTLGPLVRPDAADFVRAQVDEAVRSGATALLNPSEFSADRPGTQYMAPQVVVDVDHSMRLMTEESFGPVLGVMRVSSDEEAIALMNDSEFGLTASIWTRDLAAAERIGEEIETGTVFMNRCDYLDPALAWTGVKHTGRGCTLSRVGYEHLTRPKSFHMKWHVGG